MPNRLAQSSSPYLRQHEDNPVDWQEWGAEAFDQAQQEQKPILLSVGYSSCHWCHVMAHESFEDEEVAAILNQHFVSIKVDREELPHVDETYMTAVQLSSGQGGWPMTVFLTPDKQPFFAGTYFPKHDRPERMGFLTLCNRIVDLWANNRESLLQAGRDFAEALQEALETQIPAVDAVLGIQTVEQVIEASLDKYDPQYGGFGGAPKFPPHTALSLLFDFANHPEADEDLRRRSLHVVGHTLEAMCLGGFYDHVGGGFHRYSTDRTWHLPHFEKMLYDNALMLGNLARASAAMPSYAPVFDRAIQKTVAWLQREMVTSDGLLGSAIDADSEGVEGKFYVWTEEELREVIGPVSNEFTSVFGIQAEGNFHDEATRQLTGENLLHAQRRYGSEIEDDLERLLEHRSTRIRPLFDHKAIVSWNALAIEGLVAAGERAWAMEIADRLLSLVDLNALPRTITDGVTKGVASLEDQAGLLCALIVLGDSKYDEAIKTLSDGLDTYRLPSGMYSTTKREEESLFGQIVPAFDQPTPSGSSLVARALVLMNRDAEAGELVRLMSGWIERAPTATEGLTRALLHVQKIVNETRVNWQVGRLFVSRAGHTVQRVSVIIDGATFHEAANQDNLELELPSGCERVAVEVTFCSQFECLMPQTRMFTRSS